MDRQEQIEELRRMFILGKEGELKFDKFAWRGREKTRNCFAYALNLKEGKIESEWICWGKYVNKKFAKKETLTINQAYKLSLKMLKVMKVQYRKCRLTSKVPKGYYKVAIVISTNDIHWMRQDNDDTWSHKQGWYRKPSNRDRKGKKL